MVLKNNATGLATQLSDPLARAESCNDEGSLRLVGWLEADAGRLEVCRNGVWGTICVNESLDLWPHKNAEVACRDLGYAGALNSLFHHTYVHKRISYFHIAYLLLHQVFSEWIVGHFSRIPGDKRVSDSEVPIHFSRVRCSGEQKSLLDCQISEDTDQCTHNQDAAIVCRRGQACEYIINILISACHLQRQFGAKTTLLT